MIRIAITSSGSSTGFGFINYLSKLAGVYVISLDINPSYKVFASSIADEHIVSPLATEDGYEQTIRKIVKERKIDYILPIHNLEIEKLSKCNDIEILTSSPNVNIINDKLACYDACLKFGIPAPKTWSQREAAALVGIDSLFAKQVRGVGSVGAKVVTQCEVQQFDEDYLFQELCSGPELTIDCIASENNGDINVFSLCRERVETKAGVSTKAKVTTSKSINSLSQKIAVAFELKGGFCYQVMNNKDNELVVTDLNPRLGGGTALSQATGANVYGSCFEAYGIKEFAGSFISLKEYIASNKNFFVTRAYQESSEEI